AHRMQVQCARQFFQLVVIVAHGRARLQPCRLGLRTPRRKIELDEFYRAGHLLIRCESPLYDAKRQSENRGRPSVMRCFTERKDPAGLVGLSAQAQPASLLCWSNTDVTSGNAGS